jgi:hypothetical protein
MKLTFNQLERIYLAAKANSKGLVADLSTDIEISQTDISLRVTANNKPIYGERYGVSFEWVKLTPIPNQLDEERRLSEIKAVKKVGQPNHSLNT